MQSGVFFDAYWSTLLRRLSTHTRLSKVEGYISVDDSAKRQYPNGVKAECNRRVIFWLETKLVNYRIISKNSTPSANHFDAAPSALHSPS
jgi:hypothetical protein